MSTLARRYPHDTIYRLGRRDPGAWRFPDWLHADETGTFGSRYDDPESEYRVLYACSVRACAFIEVLAYHAADQQLDDDLAEIDENDDSDIEYASVPPGHLDVTAFCAERSVGTATVPEDRRFASIADPVSLDALNAHAHLLETARAAGVATPLTAEELRVTQTRVLTQQISRDVWEQSTTDGAPEFAGIHYLSRHDETADNWALFELEATDTASGWSVVADEHEAPLVEDDPDLVAAIVFHDITAV